MEMTDYARRTRTEARTYCLKTVKHLKEEVDFLETECSRKVSRLNLRIKDCQETIDRINEELGS